MPDNGSIQYKDRHGKEALTHFVRVGAGPCVVLIHGVGMQAAVWESQIAALSESFDVIAYDMLGHGKSSLPPSDASLSDYAWQLLALMERLGVNKAGIIGHSMGALVALEFCLTHPERVTSVVAMNAVFCRAPEQKQAIAERVKALQTGSPAAISDQAIARWFGSPVPAPLQAQAEQVRGILNAVDPEGYRRAYKIFAESDEAHKDRLEHLAMPALFMTGECDALSTAAMSYEMARRAPMGRSSVLWEERHMMSLTAPVEVNRQLLSFLGEQTITVGNKSPTPIDKLSFRRALGTFLTGVTVVATTQKDGQPRGFTANSFTSVSLDPPLISICIARTAASFPIFSTAEHFSVNILADSQVDLSGIFASKSPEKFNVANWGAGKTGSPILEEVAAWFDCRRYETIEAGDHIILIGQVVDFAATSANPLGYCRGAHVIFDLSLDKVAASGALTRVGAILEQDGKILLIETSDGSVDLPYGGTLGSLNDAASLMGKLHALGMEAELGFLFSVFEDARRGTGAVSIYYRGILKQMPAAAGPLRLIRFEDVPWDRLRDKATQSMLQRYIEERRADIFGIYVGDDRGGTVQPLARLS